MANRCTRIPEIMFPREGVDLSKWAVIACDQYTSQPDYWAETDKTVGDAPSTLRLTLPEVYLEDADVAPMLDSLEALGEKYQITFIISISQDAHELPENMQSKVIVSL